MSILKAKNLTKIYGEKQTAFKALDNVDLEIKKGEMVGIMGRSGSGKSTLLYQLSLLDRPSSGQIFIDDLDMTNRGVETCTQFRLANLGYVFQDYALLPDLNTRENVALPMLMLGFTLKDAYKRAEKSLKSLGLGDKFRNMPNQLSGGEQQRVSIARATAHGARIIFADEPTASLDTDTADQVMDIFRELKNDQRTIVMVTHEPEYKSYFDRVITLEDGRIK
jgi:putative ABC transport system ATP-binding protein